MKASQIYLHDVTQERLGTLDRCTWSYPLTRYNNGCLGMAAIHV